TDRLRQTATRLSTATAEESERQAKFEESERKAIALFLLILADAAQARIPLLLRPHEAAEALAISERKLWGLTDRGEIPCVRIDGAVRYALGDLVAWIDAKRQGGVQ